MDGSNERAVILQGSRVIKFDFLDVLVQPRQSRCVASNRCAVCEDFYPDGFVVTNRASTFRGL